MTERDTGVKTLTSRDIDGLLFAAEMYGLQLDQLSALLGVSAERARSIVSRWRELGFAESARLGPGPMWVWVTRSGLAACGLHYTVVPPALSRLAHIRAVTAVRLALEGTAGYQQARAYWRGERRLRSGYRLGTRDHLPDGEVHWPDSALPSENSAPLDDNGTVLPWAGECWAIEAELTRKTVARTAAIMRELLSRTGDYGCSAAEASVPGRPTRHARALYLCSAAALPTVTRAREELGPLAARIEIRDLPVEAPFPGAAAFPAGPIPGGPTSGGHTSGGHTSGSSAEVLG
jgi:hypothetical protein